jgi:hypothetical protein
LLLGAIHKWNHPNIFKIIMPSILSHNKMALSSPLGEFSYQTNLSVSEDITTNQFLIYLAHIFNEQFNTGQAIALNRCGLIGTSWKMIFSSMLRFLWSDLTGKYYFQAIPLKAYYLTSAKAQLALAGSPAQPGKLWSFYCDQKNITFLPFGHLTRKRYLPSGSCQSTLVRSNLLHSN